MLLNEAEKQRKTIETLEQRLCSDSRLAAATEIQISAHLVKLQEEGRVVARADSLHLLRRP